MLSCGHSRTARALCIVALLAALLPAQAVGAEVTPVATPPESHAMTVEVVQPTPAVSAETTFSASVVVTVEAPTDYLEVRVRLKTPSGRLVYQKTEVRNALPAGSHAIAFERELRSLNLKQGRYPIEVRVRASGADVTNVASRLLVIAPGTTPMPVAIVITTDDAPAVGADGRFVRDPATDSRLRDELAYLTDLAARRDVHLSLALPPILVQQFARAAAGYETAAGVAVPKTSDASVRYDRALQGVRSAVESGAVDLVDVPYALPDLAGLAAMHAESDLVLHWAEADAVRASAFGTAPTAPVAYLGPRFSAADLASLSGRGVQCVLSTPEALRSGDATTAPGCYSLRGQAVRSMVVDEAAASALADGAESFYDALFARLEDGGSDVIMLKVGAAHPDAALQVEHALGWIADAWWLRSSSLAAATKATDPPLASLTALPAGHAPSGYWTDVSESRSAVLAYRAAAGDSDTDAVAALRTMLGAESALWAGAHGTWADAADGRALARQPLEFVLGQFASIRLDAKDVTLSGSKGDVPLTLINGTGKVLRLAFQVTNSSMNPASAPEEIVVQPTQNFLTVPVDLGNALSDALTVSVRAGDVSVATAIVNVRASYVDRLATIAMVVVVLGGMLLFIRRRAKRMLAGTIQEGPEPPGMPDGQK